MNLNDLVHDLISHIGQGKILEAMNTFYHADATMQENRGAPTKGLAANIEREKQFLAQIKDWHGFEATNVAITETAPGTGVAAIENWLEFTNTEGNRIRYEQVSVQKWKDGKIVRERFYYDTGA